MFFDVGSPRSSFLRKFNLSARRVPRSSFLCANHCETSDNNIIIYIFHRTLSHRFFRRSPTERTNCVGENGTVPYTFIYNPKYIFSDRLSINRRKSSAHKTEGRGVKLGLDKSTRNNTFGYIDSCDGPAC